jgi:small neutral amino acid transporter SnatA (MarC family)
MLLGRSLMDLLGLSDESIKAAGGVILFLIAINMVFPGSGAQLGGGSGQKEPFIVPIAVPLISGPSAIATAMVIAAEDPTRILEWLTALALCMAAIVIVLFACGRIKKILGEEAIIAIERLMGLLLTAMAIDMMLNGAASYIRKFLGV